MATAQPIIEIDLSQDDSDDDLWEANQKNDETKPTAAVQKNANESNKKKSSNIDAPNNVVVIKSSPPSTPTKQQQPQQQQKSSVLLIKRQRTRSTGVRHKVSDIQWVSICLKFTLNPILGVHNLWPYTAQLC